MTATPAPSAIGQRARRGMSMTRLVTVAIRELRSGFGGFYTFIACIALGVAVITAVGGLSEAIDNGLSAQGERILGGDMTFSRMHRRANDDERAWLASKGDVSELATARAMARVQDGSDQTLIEIKAVDEAYPLVGTVKLKSTDEPLQDVLAKGIAIDPIVLERLNLKIGDPLRIGDADLTVAATIDEEPDAVADRLTYGPRVLLSTKALETTGLVQPGTLARWRYALKFPNETTAQDLSIEAVKADLKQTLPNAGFSVLDRRNPAPNVTRVIDRLRQFLTFLGLAALMVGGVGVASSVTTFVDRRRNVIATLKSLGASRGQVLAMLLIQIMSIAAVGVAIGLVIGAAVPIAIASLFGDTLPVKIQAGFSWISIANGALYGLLVALLFSLWPIGRAEQIRPSMLFRDAVAPVTARPRVEMMIATAAVAVLVTVLAVFASESKLLALGFCAAVVIVLLLFSVLGEAISRLARRIPRVRRPVIRLAQLNVGAPDGLTRAVMLALGTGLSLLVAVALTDASLVKELKTRLPAEAPTYFVLDIPKNDHSDFVALTQSKSPEAKVVEAPMLRGRIVSLKGVPVEKIDAPPEAQWVLRGDRGLTYSDDVPAGSSLREGKWWAKDYAGPPLVSFDANLAKALNLTIGDTVTVNVLGRNLTATVSNLRDVTWQSLRLNFVMVFSPSALRAAPHTVLATVTLPDAVDLKGQAEIERALGQRFPTVTLIRVQDAIDAFNDVFSKIMMAVRVAGGVTLIAGALVLAGALATTQRRRVQDAVILKVLGANRWQILGAHLTEYLALAAIAAACATLIGGLASWIVVEHVMKIAYNFSWEPVVQALAISAALIAVFGTVGTLGVLRARPATYLRTD